MDLSWLVYNHAGQRHFGCAGVDLTWLLVHDVKVSVPASSNLISVLNHTFVQIHSVPVLCVSYVCAMSAYKLYHHAYVCQQYFHSVLSPLPFITLFVSFPHAYEFLFLSFPISCIVFCFVASLVPRSHI